MADLVCDCTGDIVMSPFPTSCGSEEYGFPFLLLFQKIDGEIAACTGDAPTVGQLQALIGAGGDDSIIVVGPITNGQRVESEREEETGADTIDNMTDVISQTIQITGKLKHLDEDTREDLESLNCESRLRCWIITHTGWIFGECTGYVVANYISSLLHDGYGSRAYIPLDYKFKRPGHEAAVQDEDYLTLVNP